MRHRVEGRKFGRETDQRRLMMNNLVKSMIEHGQITTTLAKAKEMRRYVERVVTYGKNDTVHSRRLAYKVLGDRTLVKKLFTEIAPAFQDRNGGYTALLKPVIAEEILLLWLLSNLLNPLQLLLKKSILKRKT